MKKTIYIFPIVLVAVLVSCNKSVMPVEESFADAGKEIVIGVGDTMDAVVTTKATAVTSLSGNLYWGASTGTSTETVKWATATGAVSSNKISTGKYLASTPVAYNYYVANQNFTVAGDMTVANNNTDVIAGRCAQNSTAAPPVTLNHIFARTGTLTCNTQSGYTISNVSWKIVGKSTINGTAGTFNMKSQTWTAASTKLTAETALTSSSDMYLIPGTYTIKVTYTLTRGDWSGTFTKSADVTFVGGKVNNITVTAIGGSASQIVLNLTLTAWGTEDHTPTLS